MASFGISFPKLTLCRSSTSKTDTNTVSTTTLPTTGARTLSLSIKNVPSQPLHYDVSTTAIKKKPSSITTILAIDGETKQLPKNLSVFNELQLDDEVEDIHEKKRRRQETSSDIIVPSSLSPRGAIDIPFLSNEERQSNHTFTPPTSSLSNDSLGNDLHLTLSSISVDLPQLKYAIEKFLIDDDNPIYHIPEDFPSSSSLFRQDHNVNAHSSNVSTSDLKHCQHDNIDSIKLSSMHDNQIQPLPPSSPKNMKWYVSELRINRPLIYRTNWTYGQQYGSLRKLSQSVNDLKQLSNNHKNGKQRLTTDKLNSTTYSTLSLQNFNNQQQQQQEVCHRSDDNILLTNHLSSTDDNQSDEDDHYLSSLIIQRTLGRSVGKDDTLIRNESVKQKLFDILNDDELENACLQDMSQEFEKMSLTHHHDLPVLNSFSSDDDDVLYSSPPNELQLPMSSPLVLSSSYDENLSSIITTERYFGRSRLITTSLDKIPMNTHSSSSCLLHSSYEHTRPSWYTSPSPQWRMDDQLPITSGLKRDSSKKDDHLNGLDTIDSNRFLRTKVISYSLMNTSTPLVDDSKTMLPIIQDKSSNLIMFI